MPRKQLARVLLLLALLPVAPAFAEKAPESAILDGVKSTEEQLGIGPTRNFLKFSAGADFFRCYYTGRLELPDSYEGLRLLQDRERCARLDRARYDVFVYEPEVVARGDTPVTRPLAEATPERQAVVIAHEDFHHDRAVRKLPERIAEAAATLIGFLTAAEFARTSGEAFELYRNLSLEAALFARKAALVNSFHARLRDLYAAVRQGRMKPEAGLAWKQKLFAEIQASCQAIPPARSFGRCLSAPNNAGLAFDATYTTRYPLLWELHAALGSEVAATLQALRGIESAGLKREEAIVRRLERMAQAARKESADRAVERHQLRHR